MASKPFELGAFSNSGLVWYFAVYDLCLIVYFSYLHAFIHLLFTKTGSTNMQYFQFFGFYFCSFSVLQFSVVVSVRQIKPTHDGFRAHVKLASRIVSYENKVKKDNKSLQISYLTTRLHISQTTLLFNKYIVVNLSLRMTRASAVSLTPHSLIHSAAISQVLPLKVIPEHATTTCFRELSWRERTGCICQCTALIPYGCDYCHFSSAFDYTVQRARL